MKKIFTIWIMITLMASTGGVRAEGVAAVDTRPEQLQNFHWIGAGLGLVGGAGIGWIAGAATVTAFGGWIAGGLIVGAVGGYLVQQLANWINERAHRNHVARAPARSVTSVTTVAATTGGLRLLGMTTP